MGIPLDRADFFELVAALRTHELHRLEAHLKAVEADASGKKGRALFVALAEKHGFDPAVEYGFDESTCELIPKK